MLKILQIFLLSVIVLCLIACDFVISGTSILSAEEVGDKCLPEEIAPIKSPFIMPELKEPVFPDTIIRLLRADASDVMQTAFINRQINALSEAGGGTISLEKGQWQVGRIELKSNINLHISDGAEIHFSGNIEDYLPVVFTRFEGEECLSSGAFIYANNQRNIALTGRGKLIAPPLKGEIFDSFWKQFNNKTIRKIDVQSPVEERIYDGSTADVPMLLPKTFSPVNCTDVFVEGIQIEGSLTWNIAPVYCENVIVRGVNIYSVGVPTGDGIDIDSSKNVLVEYCTLSCGNDCITIKSGRSEDGVRINKSSENIVIRYCLTLHGDGGVTCGSETAGGIKNLYVHDCVFNGTTHGLRFKTRRERGGGGESLYYERIRIQNTTEALCWDMLGSTNFMGELAERYPIRRKTYLTPSYSYIFMKDIVVENACKFISASGIPESPLANIRLENVKVFCIKLPKFTDVDGFDIRNSSIASQDSVMTCVDARNITLNNVKMTLLGKLYIHKEGSLTNNILIK